MLNGPNLVLWTLFIVGSSVSILMICTTSKSIEQNLSRNLKTIKWLINFSLMPKGYSAHNKEYIIYHLINSLFWCTGLQWLVFWYAGCSIVLWFHIFWYWYYVISLPRYGAWILDNMDRVRFFKGWAERAYEKVR
jgi:hypothetical protein